MTLPPRLTASYEAPATGYPAVSRLLLRQLADGFPPATAVRVCTSEGSPYSAAGGWARLADAGFPEPVPADADTLFDLASLTKVVTTLPLVLLLHQGGRWSIDDPLSRWLPGAPRSPVTISHCLLHVAGLVPHRPYYAVCADPAEIRRAVTAELADAVPGQVSYSDLGFMLLGWAVEECAGEPLEELAGREVLGPLGMTSTGYRPRAPVRRIAATEADGDQRSGQGSVHDGNAFALGGISGHAGLFGTGRGPGPVRERAAYAGPPPGAQRRDDRAHDRPPGRRGRRGPRAGLAAAARFLGRLAGRDHLAHRLHGHLAADRAGARRRGGAAEQCGPPGAQAGSDRGVPGRDPPGRPRRRGLGLRGVQWSRASQVTPALGAGPARSR